MLIRARSIFRLRQGGFTVAELMTTMAVFVIVMAIAVPNFVAFQPSQRLNGATREVLGRLMWARAKAVQENNQFVVQIPNNTSLLIFDDQNNDRTLNVGEWNQIINIQANYNDVTIAITSGDPNPTFNPRGTTVGGSTTITLTNPSGVTGINVSATGNVSIN